MSGAESWGRQLELGANGTVRSIQLTKSGNAAYFLFKAIVEARPGSQSRLLCYFCFFPSGCSQLCLSTLEKKRSWEGQLVVIDMVKLAPLTV